MRGCSSSAAPALLTPTAMMGMQMRMQTRMHMRVATLTLMLTQAFSDHRPVVSAAAACTSTNSSGRSIYLAASAAWGSAMHPLRLLCTRAFVVAWSQVPVQTAKPAALALTLAYQRMMGRRVTQLAMGSRSASAPRLQRVTSGQAASAATSAA